MIDVMSLAASGLAFFVVAVTPGPANISNAAIAMKYGRKISLIYGAGLSTGLVFWGLVAATGMGAVLQTSFWVLSTLKVLGGLYLLWLAYSSARVAMTPSEQTVDTHADTGWFLRGLVLNMSNPKSVVAWMAALSVGLQADDGLAAVVAATLVCIVVGFFNNAVYSMVFSIPGMMRIYRRAERGIHGAMAALFALAGLGLLRSAFVRSS